MRASSRALAWLFLSKLGVTFVHWRYQVRLATVLPRLTASEAVARIAVDLDYQTPSAFSAMFRHLTGSTSSRYFASSDSAQPSSVGGRRRRGRTPILGPFPDD